MGQSADQDKIYLQLSLSKSLQRDDDGNVIFTAEASNENLDIEQQRVLQRALLQTQDYFVKNGVISKDHKHREFHKDGSYDIHEEFVIGEPIEVTTQGTRTFVRGKLYPNNDYAKKFIKLLDQGSTRVKASVGGLVPRLKKGMENGRKIGEIISVLWDDLALTITPVNPTVEPAVSMAKSLSSVEFVKALSIGYGTDSAEFTGGRALQKEDVEHEKSLLVINEAVIASLVGAMSDGDVTGLEEAESFLVDYGISRADARDIVRAVCKKSNSFMEVFPMAQKAGTLWDDVKGVLASLTKSNSGKKPENDDDPADTAADPTNSSDDDDDDEYEDGTEVLKSLNDKMADLGRNIEIMAKAQTQLIGMLQASEVLQKSLGQGILAIMDRTEDVLASPAPRKGAVSELEAVMAKAGVAGTAALPGGAKGGGLRPFTQKTLDITKDILTKAVGTGEIDIYTCAGWETQMNKSIGKASFAFSDDFERFMRKHVSKEGG